MTDAARPFFADSIARAQQQQQLQMWRAAETVRSHVPLHQGREDLLECLGLTDVERPTVP